MIEFQILNGRRNCDRKICIPRGVNYLLRPHPWDFRLSHEMGLRNPESRLSRRYQQDCRSGKRNAAFSAHARKQVARRQRESEYHRQNVAVRERALRDLRSRISNERQRQETQRQDVLVRERGDVSNAWVTAAPATSNAAAPTITNAETKTTFPCAANIQL